MFSASFTLFQDCNRTIFSVLRHRNDRLPLFIVEVISPSFNHLLLHCLKFSLRLGKLIIIQIYVAVYRLYMKTKINFLSGNFPRIALM